jgi:AcrR family transcriptional regulator
MGRAGAGQVSQTAARTTYHHGELHQAALRAAMGMLDRTRTLPTLREIAAECGVTHAALYRHFANQESLALELAAICFRELAAAIRFALAGADAVGATPAARLRIGSAASIAWGLAHPGRYLFMTGPELAGKQDHAAFFGAAREAFGTLVEGVAGMGVQDPVPVAHTVLCMLHGLTDFTCKGRTVPYEAESVDAQIERLLDAVVAVTTRHAGPRPD